MTSRQRVSLSILFAVALTALYLYAIGGVGVIGPDEPRYAAIGNAMAHNGDWVTPQLWGQPWFEKPAFLYWITACGNLLGLSPDIAGRVPVALFSLGFLAAWFWLLSREFGQRAAAVATLLLATSAAWLAYSGLCLTDVPLTIFYSLAVVLALPLLIEGSVGTTTRWLLIGAAFALAALSKGLLPLVLSAPFLWFLRRHWRRWPVAILAFLVIAAPWYTLVIARNGFAFIEVFFLRQQFSRLYSESLQHVQPVYFYIPILLGCLFPWTPLLAILDPREWRRDTRLLFLACIFLFGFVFFSVSRNKLPGYLLPLLPCLFALIGQRFEKFQLGDLSKGVVIACAALIAIIPLLASFIPLLFTTKITSVQQVLLAALPITGTDLVFFVTPLLIAVFANRNVAPVLLCLSVVAGGIFLKTNVYPVLDHDVSPRGLWREVAPFSAQTCDDRLNRNWQYGFAFYRGAPYPICDAGRYPYHLIPDRPRRPKLIDMTR